MKINGACIKAQICESDLILEEFIKTILNKNKAILKFNMACYFLFLHYLESCFFNFQLIWSRKSEG